MNESSPRDETPDWALDGNAVGGVLRKIFGVEMTTAVATCATCGTPGLVAETVVYLRAPGVVVRCRTCAAVLMVVIRRGDRNCLDFSGLAALEQRAG